MWISLYLKRYRATGPIADQPSSRSMQLFQLRKLNEHQVYHDNDDIYSLR